MTFSGPIYSTSPAQSTAEGRWVMGGRASTRSIERGDSNKGATPGGES